MATYDAIVVGAGVIGLTSAVRLAEAGLRTIVFTAHDPAATTSYAAGASWGPHLIADQPEVVGWSGRTLAIHRDLATVPGTGVRIGAGIEASRTEVSVPSWASVLDDVRIVERDELPPGFVAGWFHRTPLIDMPAHLAYLRQRYVDRGGIIRFHRVTALADAGADVDVVAPIVVNCTGMGARDLIGDDAVSPVRGQVVICENPGISEFFVENPGPHGDLTYMFPHGDTMVLGGQAVAGDYRLDIDPEVADDIVRRCTGIDSRLRGARILEHRVGLRPTRPTVRLEAVDENGTRIIHNYGHGGSGVTLSWGCAEAVTALAG